MKPFTDGELTIERQATDHGIQLSWLGRSDARDPNALLSPMLSDMLSDLPHNSSVKMDFTNFDYMNSSTVRPILTFIMQCSKAGHNVDVTYNAERNWQRLSFKALETVCAQQENVRIHG